MHFFFIYFPSICCYTVTIHRVIRQLNFYWTFVFVLFCFFHSQKTARNPYVDIFVAIITVPTLILLALLLDANIQTDRETTAESRSTFIVLIFGFSFLVLSSLICGCIVHKMGMCRWDRQRYEEEVITSNRTDSIDCVHVIDLPPTYESVTTKHGANLTKLSSFLNPPPPTYEMACSTEKLAPSTSTSTGTIHHIWYSTTSDKDLWPNFCIHESNTIILCLFFSSLFVVADFISFLFVISWT